MCNNIIGVYMKKIFSIALFLCVLGSTAKAMEPTMTKEEQRLFEIALRKEAEQRRLIEQKVKMEEKKSTLKRSQERDRKLTDSYGDNES